MQPTTPVNSVNPPSTKPRPKPWVRLRLESQNERSPMPSEVIGILQEDDPARYVLSNILISDSHGRTIESSGWCFFNKTYVWCCEILGDRPDIEDDQPSEEITYTGGLG